ncbi:N-alpha-acetyltransferase 25, NatB auxiliary subunit [Pelomyxa schiedti]|nr:N-alpha-acetyltransferase 25, NatB auxiliary subunit [Pelomyxa schiedti]
MSGAAAAAMAAKQAEMRRCRPIYDALEIKNYKLSLKLCNGILKKHAAASSATTSLDLVRTLKALTLASMGSRESRIEAEELLAVLRSANPRDEGVLVAMLAAHRALNRVDLMTEVYLSIWRAQPTNEKAGQDAFCAYVRIDAFSEQQSVALDLFRQFGNPMYSMWRITSTFLQARCSNPSLAPLAEAMLKKYIAEGKPTGINEIELLLQILEFQNKLPEMVSVIVGPHGPFFDKPSPEHHLNRECELRMKLKEWEKCLALFTTLLKEYQTFDWWYFTGYLDCVINLCQSNQDQLIPMLNEFHTLLLQCQERTSSNRDTINRGPFLASLELHKRALNCSVPTPFTAETLLGSLAQYIKLFGTKPSCLLDLRPYLLMLSELPSLDKSKIENLVSIPESENLEITMRLSLLRHQINHLVGLHKTLSSAQAGPIIDELLTMYRRYIVAVPPKDAISSANELIIFVAFLLQELAFRENKLAYIVEAIILLEYGVSISSQDFNFRTTLISLYKLLGAIGPAVQQFCDKHSDVKNILYETLGHLVFDSVVQDGFQVEVSNLSSRLMEVHRDNDTAIPDNTALSYKQGTWFQIPDFIDFKNKMKRSHLKAAVQVYSVWSNVIKEFCTKHPPQEAFPKLVNGLRTSFSNAPDHIYSTTPEAINSLEYLADNTPLLFPIWAPNTQIESTPLGFSVFFTPSDKPLRVISTRLHRIVLRCLHLSLLQPPNAMELKSSVAELQTVVAEFSNHQATQTSTFNTLFFRFIESIVGAVTQALSEMPCEESVALKLVQQLSDLAAFIKAPSSILELGSTLPAFIAFANACMISELFMLAVPSPKRNPKRKTGSTPQNPWLTVVHTLVQAVKKEAQKANALLTSAQQTLLVGTPPTGLQPELLALWQPTLFHKEKEDAVSQKVLLSLVGSYRTSCTFAGSILHHAADLASTAFA